MKREEFLAELEAGPYAWPGGYPRYFLAGDGEAISFQAASDNRELVLEECDNLDRASWDGWKVIGCEVHWEGAPLICIHTGEAIESAYGDPEEEGLHHIQESPDSDETLCGADSVLFATSETPDAEICSECRGRRDSQVPIAGNG